MPRDITAKKVVSWGSSILLFIIIAGYGIWISRDLLFGIHISVSGIYDGEQAAESILSLGGTARHANKVTVDGHIVPIAQSGAWSDTIVLLPGYNIVSISATDKFGRTNIKTYHVYYSTSLPTSPAVQ